jgi:hypothetical protein
MKTKHIFLITLVVMILCTLALPAMGSSMALQPTQMSQPAVHADQASPAITYTFYLGGCGSPSTTATGLRSFVPPAEVCPSVAWNS